MTTSRDELNPQLLSLFTNEEIVNKLKACKSSEECYNIAKPYISDDISLDKFKESLKLIKAYMEENKDGYLGLKDLDEVAGGMSDFWKGFISGAEDALSGGLL